MIVALAVSALRSPTQTEEESDGPLVWPSTDVVDGVGTLTPDHSRPGLGLELRRGDAHRYQINADG